MKMEVHMLESIKSVEDIIKDNGCITFNSLTDVANYLNNEFISSVSIHDSCPIVWNFYWCDIRFCLHRKGDFL